LPFMPIILVTAKTESKDIVEGLEAGADEYLGKPVDHAALVARVGSILRIKEMHDTIEAQSAELAGWNRELESRVAAQLTEIERMGRLKRFLSPQIAELVLAAGEDKLLESHRREITVVFCDLRGFTAFSETTEPEDLMRVLGEYHAALGARIHQFEGTVEHFAGDGVMILFNDPLPCPDHAERAVSMAVAMRDSVGGLARDWQKRGYHLGFGVGIAQGYATLGRIGFEGRFDYAAIGSVVNLASRLSDEAKDGQIVVSEPVQVATEGIAQAEPLGALTLKGLHRPVKAFNVTGLKCAGDGATDAKTPSD
ncbi:MAG: adenylate/guanylate cyclase domain-containing response regulator, partial [Alphaproteobacteria bacterium]|nr:adenylate/guanylate cyclase domain-containing response regulator [Alphaproteobacteria bacterium]